MKARFFLSACLLALLGAGTLSAQDSGQETYIRAGGTLKTAAGKLTAEQRDSVLFATGGDELVGQWQSLDKTRRTGNGLIIGGSSLAAAGVVTYLGTTLVMVVGMIVVAPVAAVGDSQSVVDDYTNQFKPYLTVAGIAAAAGAAVALAGIPVTVKSTRSMKRIVGACNQAACAPELSFGLAPGGVGLVYRF